MLMYIRLLMVALLLVATLPAFAEKNVKAIYHLNDGRSQAQRAMVNIRNHLDADPLADVVVVANGSGIDFLLEGAEAADGALFARSIEELSRRGVKFLVCTNTLTQRKIGREKLPPQVVLVPSGVAEAARLQAHEGYVYLRP
jgi:uncharacterized protein